MSLSQSGRTNPLDRNHDGRVSLQDLAPINQGGMYGGMNNKVATNPLDRNHDGRVDLKDLSSNSGMGMNQGKMNHGLGMQQGLGGARHNPLDRNHDGKVDLKDIAPHSGTSQGVGNNPLYNQGMMNEGVMHQGMGMNQGLSSLDRNMDGRVDMQDLSSGAYVQSARRSSVRAEPTLVETIQKEVVVHERIHPVQKEEIQPIIFREREQMEVKQVTQMMHETQIQPTLIQQRELPAERRAAVVERSAPIAENFVAASREVDVTMRSQVVHAPIVNEIVRKTVIEEIQPVLERDVIQSTVIQNTQPIYEKIVEAPQVFRETRVINERRLSGANLDTLVAQGFDLSSMGGLGLTQSTMTSTTYNQSVLPPQMSSELNRGMHSTEMYSSGNVVMNKRKSLVEALPASYGHLMNNEGMMPGTKMMEEQRMREMQASPLPSRTL